MLSLRLISLLFAASAPSCLDWRATHSSVPGEVTSLTARNIALLDGRCAALLLVLADAGDSVGGKSSSSGQNGSHWVLMQRVAAALRESPQIIVATTRMERLRALDRPFAAPKRAAPTLAFGTPFATLDRVGNDDAALPLYFFAQRVEDRRCLLSPSPFHVFREATAQRARDRLPAAARRVLVDPESSSVAALLEAVNAQFGTHCAASGSGVTPLGEAIAAAHAGRFRPSPPPPRGSPARRWLLGGTLRAEEAEAEESIEVNAWSCERVDARTLTPDEFLRRYVFGSRPVVVTHAMEHWHAAATAEDGAANAPNAAKAAAAGAPWSAARLRVCCANASVQVKATPDGSYEGVEHAAVWEAEAMAQGVAPESFRPPPAVREQLVFPDRVLVRPAVHTVRVGTFLDAATRWAMAKKKEEGNASSSMASLYVEYLSLAGTGVRGVGGSNGVPDRISDAFPFTAPLFASSDAARAAQGLEGAEGDMATLRNLWAGVGATVGRLHFDPFENLLAVVRGRKSVVLFDPSENSDLMEGHMREGMLTHLPKKEEEEEGAERLLLSPHFSRANLAESTSMVNSPVELADAAAWGGAATAAEQAAFEARFPTFLARARPMRCVVEAGETLFIPSWWWHEVSSSTPSDLAAAAAGQTPAAAPRAGEGGTGGTCVDNDALADASTHVSLNYWWSPAWSKAFPCGECKPTLNVDESSPLNEALTGYAESAELALAARARARYRRLFTELAT